jgi:hypothetical protein
LGNVVDKLLDRCDYLRRQWYRLRRRRSPDWILYSLALGVALALGVFTSVAVTRGAAPDSTVADSRDALRLVTDDAVMRTITRKGKTRRVIRYRTKAGDAVYETVLGRERTLVLPGQTLRETRTEVDTRTITRTITKTATEIITVTQIETVTVTETVPTDPP